MQLDLFPEAECEQDDGRRFIVYNLRNSVNVCEVRVAGGRSLPRDLAWSNALAIARADRPVTFTGLDGGTHIVREARS